MNLLQSKSVPEVGNYILKTNYNTFGRDTDSTPVLKIDRISALLKN